MPAIRPPAAGLARRPISIRVAAVPARSGWLALLTNLLQGVPLLEKAMRASGFELDQAPGRRQPGRWFQPAMVGGLFVNIPIDLLIADRFAGTANSRRTASLEPHDKMGVRKVSGLELATVDFDVMPIGSLEPGSDSRSIDMRVAGPAALLVAKAYKIHDRLGDAKESRVSGKDAGDVIRLMRASGAAAVRAALGRLAERIRRHRQADQEPGYPTFL